MGFFKPKHRQRESYEGFLTNKSILQMRNFHTYRFHTSIPYLDFFSLLEPKQWIAPKPTNLLFSSTVTLAFFSLKMRKYLPQIHRPIFGLIHLSQISPLAFRSFYFILFAILTYHNSYFNISSSCIMKFESSFYKSSIYP